MKWMKPNCRLEADLLLPPYRGKAGMGVDERRPNVSTPTLTLPLQGGGEVITSAFVGLKPFLHLLGSAA
jgi:hypothetical protein